MAFSFDPQTPLSSLPLVKLEDADWLLGMKDGAPVRVEVPTPVVEQPKPEPKPTKKAAPKKTAPKKDDD